MPEFDWALTATGTLVAAGIGAFLANFAAEAVKAFVRRGQLTEAARDEDLALMLTWVSEMQDLATEYWTSSAEKLGEKEEPLRAKIVARQQNTLRLIAHLFKGEPKRECDVYFTTFMDAVGGDSFGDPDRQAEPRRLTGVYKHGMAFAHFAKQCRRNLKRSLLA